MPRAKLRTPELREQLVVAAIDTLAIDGIAGFTTRRVAGLAATSASAVYELFGDRAGLLREVYFEGFRRLRTALGADPTERPGRDLLELAMRFADWARANPALVEIMFTRPFTDFAPGARELEAVTSVRDLVVERVRRCVADGIMRGDPATLGHAVVALAQGLAAQERAGWLGNGAEAVERRWRGAFAMVVPP
jgi:AcrR family transcriptional regulator